MTIRERKLLLTAAVDIEGTLQQTNQTGFDAVTIEGGYSAWKYYGDKNEVQQ
jgi:hypothetical protein